MKCDGRIKIKGVFYMAFFLNSSFGEKLAQKSFKMMGRVKVPIGEGEALCLLTADFSLLLGDFILCTDQGVIYRPRLGAVGAVGRYDYSAISAVTVEIVKSYPCVCLTIAGGEVSRLYVGAKDADKMADFIKGKISRS